MEPMTHEKQLQLLKMAIRGKQTAKAKAKRRALSVLQKASRKANRVA